MSPELFTCSTLTSTLLGRAHIIMHLRDVVVVTCFCLAYLASAQTGQPTVQTEHMRMSRRLQQSALVINPEDPVSATVDDLVNDPTGKQHLLNRLHGDTSLLYEKWQYMSYPFYNVPYTFDPTAELGLTGAASNGSWKVAGNSGSVPVHALPFTDETVLFWERFHNNNGSSQNTPTLRAIGNPNHTETAALYNMTDNTFKPYHIKESAFCSGQTLHPNGQGLIVGGDNLDLDTDFLTDGLFAIRLYDPATQTYKVVASMERGRWYPSVIIMADGNLLIVAGMQEEAGAWGSNATASSSQNPTVSCIPNQAASASDPVFDNPTYQIMSTSNYSLSPALTLTILMEAWPINSYPMLCQLPQGSVLIISGSLMDVLFFGPHGAMRDDATGLLPTFPVPVTYPQSAGFTLLPLQAPDYKAVVLVTGASSEYCANAKSPAGSISWLMDVSPGANHSLVQEQMAFKRVMGELTLLPDGRVFQCNGAQTGVSGGGGAGVGVAFDGTTVAEIYDPSKPIGQRWSTVADSMIWRMYHSEAFLTSNADVFVSGSETTAEHRVQIYTPDYLHTDKARPVITAVQATLGYSQNFTIGFANVSSLDRIVLNRYSGSTHGNHADQRQIVLECTIAGNNASCGSPPNNYIAPPGVYMLFVLNEGVPSKAKYVTLQLMEGSMTKLPEVVTAG